MRIALSADHAGYALKDQLVAWLKDQGHEVADLGTNGPESVDYPEYGAKLAKVVGAGGADRGIAVCGSGIGIAIAINRDPRCRCAHVSEPLSAQLARTPPCGPRHGQGLRRGLPEQRLLRRPAPAPRRPAL